MAPTSRIGFHASSTVENPGVEVSSYGNAVIGAFLYEIGLREPATIVYLTKASPQSMTWLTMADATRYGIATKAFSLSEHEWSWAQEALTGSNMRRIDPPVPIPATRPTGSAAASDEKMADPSELGSLQRRANELQSDISSVPTLCEQTQLVGQNSLVRGRLLWGK